MRRLAFATFLLALALPAPASAASFAIGVEKGADSSVVAQRIEARTGLAVSRIGPIALAVRAPSAAGLSSGATRSTAFGFDCRSASQRSTVQPSGR